MSAFQSRRRDMSLGAHHVRRTLRWTFGSAARIGSQVRTNAILSAAIMGLGMGACKDTSAPQVPSSLLVTSGGDQQAEVGTRLTTPILVKVADANNAPINNQVITVVVGSGGGSFSSSAGGNPSSVTSDAAGTAAIHGWTLGTTAGPNTLVLVAGGVSTTITATGKAGAPAAVTKQAGDGQTAAAGAAVAVAPSVQVRDQHGNAVSGQNVVFAITSGGGSVATATVATDASGTATAGGWTLGTTVATNTLTATASPAPAVTFTATAVAGAPAQITKQAGDNQSATAGAAVATAPSVRVSDAHNNPIANVVVTFVVASGGGTVAGASATTNASGIATAASWTLGGTAGTKTLTATVGSLPAVTFTATAVAGAPAQVTINAGNNQTAQTGATVPIAPSVLVRDAQNNPVPGATVIFAVTAGGGSLVGAVATTNASGIATVGSWTLGLAGANTLSATVGSLPPVTFTATAQAGAAAQLTKNLGDNQTAPAGTNVLVAPSVLVRDAQNNPVSGVTVTFAVATGGGSVTGGSAVTNASGIATVGSWKLGNLVGANTLTATIGAFSVTFTAQGTGGTAALLTKVTGDAQTAGTGQPVPVAPSVRVTDQFGNPVAGVSVTFTSSAGGSVIGGTVASNATGNATVGQWTLGATPGTYSLTASSAGVPSVVFTATATGGACPATPTAYTIGTTVNGTLAAGDCLLGAIFADRYGFTLAGAAAIRFAQSSTTIDTHLHLHDQQGRRMAENDDTIHGTIQNSVMRVLVAPGTYQLSASAFAPSTGAYTLMSGVTSSDVAGCPNKENRWFITPGLTTAQTLMATDCTIDIAGANYYEDRLRIHLRAGATYTITMSGSIQPYLELRSDDGSTVLKENTGPTTAQMVYTATATGYGLITAGTNTSTTTGAYTLSVTVVY